MLESTLKRVRSTPSPSIPRLIPTSTPHTRPIRGETGRSPIILSPARRLRSSRASALETGVATLDSVYVDPVTLSIGGGRVSCWRAGGHGRQTFVEAMENSCNPIFAILADQMTGARFHKYLTSFGFGSRTGIEFPGESPGAIPTPNDRLLRWANVGFGQGIGATALQMVMAASAIANGGDFKPYLVKEIRAPDGTVVHRQTPEVVRRVLSAKTAEEMRGIMRSVVENGSGRQGDVPGYPAAGKTGTAQIAAPEGGYLQGFKSNMASFLAFAPVDDPVFAGIVMLYKVGQEPSYGGVWAAPVFSRIAKEALEYLGVPRHTIEEEPQDDLIRVPNVINLDARDAEEILLAHRLSVTVDTPHAFVVDQTPPPGARVAAGRGSYSRFTTRRTGTTCTSTYPTSSAEACGMRR